VRIVVVLTSFGGIRQNESTLPFDVLSSFFERETQVSRSAKRRVCLLLFAGLLWAGKGTAQSFQALEFSTVNIDAGLVNLNHNGLVIEDPADSSFVTPAGVTLTGMAGLVQAIEFGYGTGNPPWSGTAGITAVVGTNDPYDLEIGWADNNNLGLTTWGGVSGISTTDHTMLIGEGLVGDPNLSGFTLIPPLSPVTSVWPAAASGNWSKSSNWVPAIVPNADGAVAVISQATSASVTIVLDMPATVGTLQLGAGSQGGGYSLVANAGSNTLTFSNSSNISPALISIADGTHVINSPVVLAWNLAVASTSSTPWTLSFGTASSITDNGNQCTLTLAGASGTLILSGSNSYTGGTTVSAGLLCINNPSAIGAGTLTIAGGNIDNSSTIPITLSTNNPQQWNSDFTFVGSQDLNLGTGAVTLSGNRQVTVNRGNLTVGGVISGSFSLTKAGSGTLVLGGNNVYTGRTTINQGELAVNGSLVSQVTVNSGGILSGTGSLEDVTVSAGGHLAPGNLNSGTLIIAGSVDFEGGNLDIVGTGSSVTAMSITGNLILNDNPAFNFSGSLAPGTYTIASYGGNLSGDFTTPNIPASDTINYGTGSDSSITLSVVPEPASLVLLAAGAIGLLGWVWRRRKIST